MERMKLITIIPLVAMIAAGGCVHWGTAPWSDIPSNADKFSYCKVCKGAMVEARGSSKLARVETVTTVSPTPIIDWRSPICKSRVIGEGVHFPRTRKEVDYVRVPCEPRSSSYACDHYSEAPYDVCLTCWILKVMPEKRKQQREKAEKARLDRTWLVYQEMVYKLMALVSEK